MKRRLVFGGRGGKRITGKQTRSDPVANDKKISTLLFNKRFIQRLISRNLDDYYAIENSCVDAVGQFDRMC